MIWALIALMGTLSNYAQDDQDPVIWSHEARSLSDTEFDLVITGKIAPGWHIFSQYTAEGGSLPTEFTFAGAGEGYELVGQTQESTTEKEYNPVFEVTETYFTGEAGFTQRIKLLDTAVSKINVNLFYQVCKEVCIPADVDLTFVLKPQGSGQEVVPEEGKKIDGRSMALGNDLRQDLKNTAMLTADTTGNPRDSGIWTLFGLGFLGGLIALLTPCVFPMIPLTVSYFTKHAGQGSKGVSGALWYGFFIVLIYFLLSLPFHVFDSVDSQILNTLATNIWLNVAFFIIFVFFAFSFFGYYELTLPASWSNAMDRASSRSGGVLGIFFMAVTLALVSFSCTGPILGGLLGGTALAEGNVATNLTIGMTGFGLALALPFALFALFPSWLQSLPKSGGWMTTVKVVLGFLELALAFKFLSNADLVGHWGLLKREVFLGIWILIFLLLTLYLFGVFRFPHDNPPGKLSLGRKITGILSAAFTVYLVLGVTGASDLRLLSGFPPPDFYSLKTSDSECPLALDCYKDFESGLAMAKQTGKPILLDFTGWACVNCRKMEANVWSDPAIYPILKDDVVIISLYVDDRQVLSENLQFDFKFDSGRVKKIRTVGEKWGTFQVVNFKTASQPYYVLMSPDLEILNPAVQHTDVETYLEWLRSGIARNGTESASR